MTMKPRALLLGVLLPLALVIFTRPAVTAQGNLARPERFTALAVNFSDSDLDFGGYRAPRASTSVTSPDAGKAAESSMRKRWPW